MIVPDTSGHSAPTSTLTGRRGAFIVFEGVDRCGKTTQCGLLVKQLVKLGVAAAAMRFPDRTTLVGQLIDQYLQSSKDVNDRAIHLLFSSNRWEAAPKLVETITGGTTVICDRYAYSGVAFSSAKLPPSDAVEPLSLEWCKSSDVGLPAPDAVIFLDLTQEQAEQRGGYGEERYEKKDLQLRVRQRFADLQALDERDGIVPWHLIDAAQSIEDVQTEIMEVVQKTMDRVREDDNSLGKLWMEAEGESAKK